LEDLAKSLEKPTYEDIELLCRYYLNCCCAYMDASDPAVYLVKAKNDDSPFPSLNLLRQPALKTYLSTPSLKYYVASVAKDGSSKSYKVKNTTAFAVWIKDGRKRIIRARVFRPALKDPPHDVLNTWRGFRWPKEECTKYVTYRDAGGIGVFDVLAHYFNAWCCRRGDVFEYVIAWLARPLQRPGEPNETVLILCGPEGLGKSVYVKAYGSCFGEHYLECTQPDSVFGRFNSSLEDKICISLEELGSLTPAQTNVCKSLVTSTSRRIERKGQEVFEQKDIPFNCIATTNDYRTQRIFSSVGKDARRWAMLECTASPTTNDPTYQKKMAKFLASEEGRKALAGFLFQVDVSGINVRKIPVTFLLQQQKLLSLDPPAAFLLGATVRREFVTRTGDAARGQNGSYTCTISAESGCRIALADLLDCYTDFCKERSEGRQVNSAVFCSRLRDILGPALVEWRDSNGRDYVQFPGLDIVDERIHERCFGGSSWNPPAFLSEEALDGPWKYDFLRPGWAALLGNQAVPGFHLPPPRPLSLSSAPAPGPSPGHRAPAPCSYPLSQVRQLGVLSSVAPMLRSAAPSSAPSTSALPPGRAHNFTPWRCATSSSACISRGSVSSL
jgi:hypothetical protein